MDSSGINSSQTKTLKRPAATQKRSNNKKPAMLASSNDQMRDSINEFIHTGYKAERFVNMVEDGSMILHPRSQFIKKFKLITKSDKKKVGQLRSELINHVIYRFYSEVKQNEIRINSKSKIDSINDDIYDLAISIHEKRKLNEPHDIFKIEKVDLLDQASGGSIEEVDEGELNGNDDSFDSEESEDEDQVDDKEITLSLIYKTLDKVLKSNEKIKGEIAELKENNRREIDAKCAELVEKNKKECNEMRGELKGELRKELDRVEKNNNKGFEAINKRIIDLESTLNELRTSRAEAATLEHSGTAVMGNTTSQLKSYRLVASMNTSGSYSNSSLKNTNLNQKKRTYQVGTNKTSALRVVDKKLYVHVGNFTNENTEDGVRKYIEQFLGDKLISIELLKSKTEKKEYHRKSFKFVTWYKHLDAVYDMKNWPEGVFVKRFNLNYGKENVHRSESKINNTTTHLVAQDNQSVRNDSSIQNMEYTGTTAEKTNVNMVVGNSSCLSGTVSEKKFNNKVNLI